MTRAPRRGRNGFSFVELLFGALILGGAFLVGIGVVDAASKRVHDASARHLADLYGRNLTARLQHVRPADLARVFGRGASASRVVAQDRLLAATNPAGVNGRVAYRPMPGLMRTGRLATTVEFETSRGVQELERAPLVYGRKLPALPPVSVEIGRGSSPVERENFQLAIALEAKPDDPIARVVLPLLGLEARHGRVTTPWAAMLSGAGSAAEAVDAIARGLGDEIPDGTYPVDWVETPAMVIPGVSSRRVRTVVYLARHESARYWLPVRFVEDGAGIETLWIGAKAARNFGAHAMAAGRGEGGVVPARGAEAKLYATAVRAFALAPRLSAEGAGRGLEPLLTVVTLPAAVAPAGSAPGRDALPVVAAALVPTGLTLAGAPGAAPAGKAPAPAAKAPDADDKW